MKLCSSYNPYNVKRMKFLRTKHSCLGPCPRFENTVRTLLSKPKTQNKASQVAQPPSPAWPWPAPESRNKLAVQFCLPT